MRILYISQSSLKTHCAETTHVFEITTNLQKVGNEVSLLVPEGRNIKIPNKVNLVELGVSGSKRIQTVLFQFALLFWLLFRLGDYEAVVVRMSSLMLAPLVIVKLKRIPLVLELNGLASIEVPIQYPRISHYLVILPIIRVIEKANIKGASIVLTVSKVLKEKALAILDHGQEERVYQITNGVNDKHFLPFDVPKENHGFSEDDFIVGFIGWLHPWMGIETIFEAGKIIKEKKEDIKFIIVGGGKALQEYSSKAQSGDYGDIKMLGPVPYEKVPEMINLFSVCLAPYAETERNTKMGGSSLKIFEYLSCGKGIVVSRIAGITDFVEHESIGLTVEPANPEELAKAVLRLHRDRTHLRRLGLKGRALVVKKYSWAAIAEEVDRVIRDLVYTKS